MTATSVAEPAAAPLDRARGRSPADLVPADPPVLTHVPRPGPGQSVTPLAGESYGGLTAQHAEWDMVGGRVLLTGRAPFVDLTGRAGFRDDGSLDGTVEMTARVAVLGLRVGDCTWQMAGWSPEQPIPVPRVELRGSTLAVDLGTLPKEVALASVEGLATTREGARVTATLPGNAMPAGEPLSARLQEAFRGLLGVDLGHLVVHRDADLGRVPAFVSNPDLFFAPARYGAEDPTALKLLNDALRAAVAGLVGPVGEVASPLPVVPPVGEAAPAADVTEVAANGAGQLPAAAASGAALPEQAGAGSPEEGGTVDGSAPAAEGAPVVEAPPVQLLMPEAPTELTPAAAARGGGVAGGAAKAAKNLPTADENVGDAQGAVTEPAAETAARAQEALAAELGERPPPSPEIVALCKRIRTAIRENRPEDEDKLLETDPTQEAQKAGGTITGSVQGQADQVTGSYQAMNSPPAGAPALTPTPVVAPDPSSPGMGVAATQAAPDPIPPENLSLDADVAATDQKIADSGIDTRVTKEIPDGPFKETRDARGELGEAAKTTPAQLAAQQQQAIDSAQGDMAQLQLQAVAAMRAARSGTVGKVGEGQGGMVGHEENTRESVSKRAQGIFDTTQKAVDALLQPLSRTAIARWEAGLTKLSQSFHDALARVKAWIDERHSGVGGTILAIGDYFGGLPGWVTKEYDRAELEFGDGVCDLLLSISTDVNGVIASAQALITGAQRDIDAAFDAMAAEFPEWAAQEKARFTGMLDGLGQRVAQAQTSFVKDVSNRAITAVNEAHAEVQAKRDEAGGLVGRVVAAIREFIDDPVKAIINGLLRLVGIPPSSFWALIEKISQVISDIADDPENFVNNLVAGLKQGFQQFFDNFGAHVLHGFWDWLFSGLKTPIPMPKDFSAGSLFSFALSLMGITWPKVREILVKHIGPTAVEVIEAAWQLISVLIEKGPDGIVELIKEQLKPETIVQTILEAAVNYLVETLIQQVIVRVIGMLNPVGAIAQAIDLIYQVCSWIFRNAARIFRFVEAVVNGMADVIAGNIGGLAKKVELALASLIPPVIDFLAGLCHLGGLPGEIADVITRLQTMVLGVMDRVIGFLAEKGRALLKRMGIGGKEKPGEGEGDDELGKVVRFTAAGEGHRLYVQTDGSQAHLMVASTPTPIEALIAKWQGEFKAGKPEEGTEDHGTAKRDLESVGPAVKSADEAATALVAGFAEAGTTPEKKAPDDSPVESAEMSIAAMLDRLFTIFEGKESKKDLEGIRTWLPIRGGERTAEVLSSWLTDIAPIEAAPIAGTSGPVWDGAEYTVLNESLKPTEVLASDANHVRLLEYFKVKERKKIGAEAQEFADYALYQTTAVLREPFFRSLGNRVAAKLRLDGVKRLGKDGADSSLLKEVQAIRYVPGAGFGRFFPWPGSPKNVLIHGVMAGDPLEICDAFIRGDKIGGVSFEEFLAEVQRAPGERTYIADVFRRKISTGDHEWIPVSMAIQVLADAVVIGRTDLKRARGWISLLKNLRSPTIGVLWQIVRNPIIVPGSAAPAQEPKPEVLGHVGSLSLAKFELVQDGLTVGTGTFHDALRLFYTQNKNLHPAAWVDALLAYLPTIMWTGSITGVPSELHGKQIGVYYRMVKGTRGDLTVADLSQEQQAQFASIEKAFKAAKAAIP